METVYAWLAQMRQQGYSDEQIYDVLISQGYTHETAVRVLSPRPRIHIVHKDSPQNESGSSEQHAPKKKHTIFWILLIVFFITGGSATAVILFGSPLDFLQSDTSHTDQFVELDAPPSTTTLVEEDIMMDEDDDYDYDIYMEDEDDFDQNNTGEDQNDDNQFSPEFNQFLTECRATHADKNDTEVFCFALAAAENNQIQVCDHLSSQAQVQSCQQQAQTLIDEKASAQYALEVYEYVDACINEQSTNYTTSIVACFVLATDHFDDDELCDLILPESLIPTCYIAVDSVVDEDAYAKEIMDFIEACVESNTTDHMTQEEIDAAIAACFIDAVDIFDDVQICDFVDAEYVDSCLEATAPTEEEILAFIEDCHEDLINEGMSPGAIQAAWDTCANMAADYFDDKDICELIEDEQIYDLCIG